MHTSSDDLEMADALPARTASRTRHAAGALLGRAQRWLAGAASGLVFFAAARPAHAGRNAPPPEPRGRIEISFDAEPRELTGAEKAVCVGISAAASGGLLYWGKLTGDQEDRDEEKRIKSETERLNKVRDEFLMDDEVVNDDDLFSSLRKRMGKAGSGEDDVPSGPEPSFDGFDGLDGLDDSDDPTPSPPPSSAPSAPTGLAEPPTGLAEPPTAPPEPPSSPAPEPADDDDGPSGDRDADIERLKRMFGSS